MNAALTSSNRVNIPSVCRLCDAASGVTVGTGVLVGPGLLLSSTLAFGDSHGEDLRAVFFEGTKKRPIEVQLVPQRYFFAASYPAHMDYCLVACDDGPLRHVQPVRVPLTRRRWPHVNEGDVILIVQHPISHSSRAASGDPDHAARAAPEPWAADGAEERRGEMRCFEEVLRRRGELFYLRANGNLRTAGCPAFNDAGQLVGLQSQTRADGEGVVNRVLSIVAVVQHLFANAQLSHLPQSTELRPEDVWETWFVEQDVSRVVAILDNFPGEDNVRAVTRKLSELAGTARHADEVAACGGIDLLLTQLLRFRTERELAYACMRALWQLSVGRPDRLLTLAAEHKGPNVLLTVLELYPDEEELQQLGIVLLGNLAAADGLPRTLVARTVAVVYPAMARFGSAAVLQKFGLHLLCVLVALESGIAAELVTRGVLAQLCHLLSTHPTQIFLVEALMRFVSELVRHEAAVQAACASLEKDGTVLQLVELLIETMLRHEGDDAILLHGNRALWALGNHPACRAALLQNPGGHAALQLSMRALIASLDLP